MNLRVLAFLWVAAGLGVGCARISIYQHTERMEKHWPVPLDNPRTGYWNSLFGFRRQSPVIDLAHECPKGWERLTTDTSFTQAVLKVVTLNLYSPWTVEVECGSGVD